MHIPSDGVENVASLFISQTKNCLRRQSFVLKYPSGAVWYMQAGQDPEYIKNVGKF